MAPPRRKSVNKRFLSEVSPDEEVRTLIKSKQHAVEKRKARDKLGDQWSNGELKRFYTAYRECGKNWKKVAAAVRTRTVEMVQALYEVNKAYLSLPEGTASVLGFLAMMSDHYIDLRTLISQIVDLQAPCDGESESNGLLETPQKSQKRKRDKDQFREDMLHSQSVASPDGCLSLLKRARVVGDQPRAVGKRTPRVPVSYLPKKDEGPSYLTLKKKSRKSQVDANDEEVAHVAALALTRGIQQGGSPQGSEKPHRQTEKIKSPPARSVDRKLPKSESAIAKLRDASIYEDGLEGGTGGRRAGIGAYARNSSSLAEHEGTVEAHRKGKKYYGKKVKVEEIRNSQSNDDEEACFLTEERQKVGTRQGQVAIEVSSAKAEESSLEDKIWRSKNFPEDEFFALDALQALAQISEMVSGANSSIQSNDERTTPDADDKMGKHEAVSASHHRDKNKLMDRKEEVPAAIVGPECANSRKAKLRKHPSVSAKLGSEGKQQLQSIGSNAVKRKRQPLLSNALDDAQNVVNGQSTLISAASEQLKPTTGREGILIEDNKKGSASDLAVSTTQILTTNQVKGPVRKESRRKIYLKKALNVKEGVFNENILNNQSDKHSISHQHQGLDLKEKLSHCLTSRLARRWCTFEWFYSSIDYPWFAKREFVEYLNHVGLGHIPRLTRVEWGVIRSSLGKPRRFSQRFLHEEREKLNQYRESVRKHYTELRTGVREGLPTDLARPLSVGQDVIAVHPGTRELHSGCVLTVDHDRCRVQFDHPMIGVESIKDTDCMPSNPLDNMPEALRRHKLPVMARELQMNGCPTIGGPASGGHHEKTLNPMNTLVKQGDARIAIPHAKSGAMNVVNSQQLHSCQTPAVAHIQAKEANAQANSEMASAHETVASSALHNSKQCNTYSKSTLPLWAKPLANTSLPSCLPISHSHSFVSQESVSTAFEIVRVSRQKANMMVDAAVQAFSSIKEGEEAFLRIYEAIDSVDRRQLASESWPQDRRSTEQVNGSSCHQNQNLPGTSEPQASGDASGIRSPDGDVTIPSELIASCVATLLTIQNCTERQYPPAAVAEMIESAVSSLHPRCAQNLPIFREIQGCMGRIKTQILSLIPI